jgi:antitoxin (DNA-binding transcriptional repressor) of toxin-antitoxin stability system
MPSITLSQLRNTRLLIALLKAGEPIELRERKRVIAHIIPVRPWPLPDDYGMPKTKGPKTKGME